MLSWMRRGRPFSFQKRGGGGAGLHRGLVTAALALSPFMLTSCQPRETPVEAESRIGQAPAGTVPQSIGLAELLDNPERYEGQVVTVAGEVNDVINAHAFTIGGEEFLPSGELLVISPTRFPGIPNRPENESLVDDDIVQVTGTVRRLVRMDLAQDVPAADLTGTEFVAWEGKPVVVVERMNTTPRTRTRGTAGPTAR